ncbi:undifferentiated embryonic cell transcription factor 1-like [Dipodomys merriami]|uniref:undifferentiated embryonic cell transcription factor 1-like n=1 Tax=Dipodomys merriami TaxID=94247 RepID=UPI003855DA0B
MSQPPRVPQPLGPRNPRPCRPPGAAPTTEPTQPAGMLLRPRRRLPLAPPSRTDLVAELLPLAKDKPGTRPRGLVANKGCLPLRPSVPVPMSPGLAQHKPWSTWETELLLAEMLLSAVCHTLPTYRQVSAALALRQVRRTPAQCCRRYNLLKSKILMGKPPGRFDAQIRELMGLLGNDQQDRCAHCGCLPRALCACAGPGPGRARAPAPTDSVLPPAGAAPPWAPSNLLQPTAVPSLNAALLQTQMHLGDIVGMLGPLQDQLLTQNQHVEQLRGSFDQTMSLAVGFILGSVATQRGVLGKPS